MSNPRPLDDANSPASSAGPIIVAATLAGLAIVRWIAMSSAAPYRAVLPPAWMTGEAIGLTRVVANALACAVFLVALPAGLLRARNAIDGRWSEWIGMVRRPGPQARGRLLWIAAPCCALPIVAIAVRLAPSMCGAYPIYRGTCVNLDAAAVLAQSAYCIVIVATELFYRGALLVAFQAAMGRKALLAMAVVCALDHVGAPWIELVSSGVGALGLGWLALRTRSVWPGVVAHLSLALGIDAVCCLGLTG